MWSQWEASKGNKNRLYCNHEICSAEVLKITQNQNLAFQYKIIIHTLLFLVEACGGAVVEALRYKPEGRGIDSRWCHWNFLLT
jgi:hypothetical protein